MTTVLGIHCGHEASCSVVRDGRLLSAIQQERVTRRKYDGQEFLSNRLPIQEALSLAGTTIDEVDVIVSSFQAAGPSGVGLQRPLFSSVFEAFDPFDPRHYVISHHLAHAASTVYPAGLREATVLVSDSAGTTSRDGADFYVPFEQFFAEYYADVPDMRVYTEMRSVYAFRDGAFELLDRAYSRPHNQPDVFVQSEASLYDNVARFLFRKEHAHGQLMALAGLPVKGAGRITADDILTEGSPPRLRNRWQLFESSADPVEDSDIAAAVQEAFTRLTTCHARRAVRMTGIPDLCCAGGVFLNLESNSAIAALPEVHDMYVPSCPHDAGISVGAAFFGWAGCHLGSLALPRLGCDFLGRPAEPITLDAAASHGLLPEDPGRVAELLAGGAIVARYAGRAEFGPRALGNRSILCHPVGCADARAKLNRLKQRQGWRPVAPMVRAEDLHTYFHGPDGAPFMNFNFTVREEFREVLAEALHADGTARVQTVTAADNPAIHDLLGRLADLGRLPVLINTSLNGPGQPIIDSAAEVIEFARHPLVDYLLAEEGLFATPSSAPIPVRRAESVVMAMFGTGDSARYVLSDAKSSQQVSKQLFLDLCERDRVPADRSAVAECLRAGLLVED